MTIRWLMSPVPALRARGTRRQSLSKINDGPSRHQMGSKAWDMQMGLRPGNRPCGRRPTLSILYAFLWTRRSNELSVIAMGCLVCWCWCACVFGVRVGCVLGLACTGVLFLHHVLVLCALFVAPLTHVDLREREENLAGRGGVYDV